jgi:CRP-like cAMP-binding protein
MARRPLSLLPGRAALGSPHLASRTLADRSSSAGETAVTVAHKNVVASFKQDPWVAGLSRYIGLADADIDAIRNILEGQRQIRKRADIVVQGYKYRKLCFIEAGMAIRYKLLHNGKRQILGVLLPGDIIGFPASFCARANFSIAAITDMSIQVCSFDAFMQACCQRPLLTMALLWLAVEETATYADHIIDTGRRAPFERVAHFFLELHSRLSAVGNASGTTFELPLSQEAIGDVLGLSAPHVNRVLRRLREDGLVTIDGHTVTLNDLEALQTMTQFESLTLEPSPILKRRG